MRAPLAGLGIVSGHALRESLLPKRLIITLLLTVGLAGAAAFAARAEVSHVWGRDLLYQVWETLDLQALQVLFPLIALLFVGPAYSREMRQRTMVYHLVRPVSRTTVFLGRYLGGVVPAAVTGSLLTLAFVLFAGAGAPPESWWALPLVACMSALVLGAIYCTLGAVFKRGLIAGLLYTFMIEVVVAGLPGSIQQLSVRFHLRSLLHGLLDAGFAERSPDVAKAVEEQARSASNPLVQEVAFDDPLTAVLVLLGVAATVLLAGVLIVRSRDFALKD
jgi:ABC-type transport system involved in multi-copper enzyme maturation permease subunit